MHTPTPAHIIRLATIVGTTFVSSVAQADIVGFDGLNPGTWSYNQDDLETPVGFPDSSTIQLTNSGGTQLRSVFFNTRQQTSEFTASFTYRGSLGFNTNQGGSFILQNAPDAASALGGYADGLGYQGIAKSIATTWDIRRNRISFSRNGIVSSGVLIEGIDLNSNNDIDFTLAYDGNFLTQRLVDTVTGVEFINSILIGDISTDLSDDFAYVGFGATSRQSDQYFSNFSYTVPTPGSLGILSAGLFAVLRRRRR